MNNHKVEQLNEIFGNAEFLEKYKDLDNFDGVYEVVCARAPEITKEDLSWYLELISRNIDNGEISEDDLENVAGGGIGILAVAAGIAGVCAAVSGCYKVGTGIGKFIYYITHRR